MPLWLRIVLCILVVEILGGLSGFVTASSLNDWFPTLHRPPGNPPNWVFGPMWSALYAAMGTAFALIWHKAPKGPENARALSLFAVQFLLNLAWSPVFFGMRNISAALVIIVLLIVMIILTIRSFLPLNRLAGLLLIPYLLWVCYATYLNAGYLVLNR